MSTPTARVFPTLNLLSDPKITKAVRDTLFGPKMRVFSGGWSLKTSVDFATMRVAPVRAAKKEDALKYAETFMDDANGKWAKAGQMGTLFPRDTSLFRMVLVESRQIMRGKTPLAWRFKWLVLADMGSKAENLGAAKDNFLPVTHARIDLTVTITGAIVAGSATWRPTLKPIDAEQKQTPKALDAHLAEAKRKAGPEARDHDHGAATTDPAQKPPPGPYFDLVYGAAERSEFCNFLDPRIRVAEVEHRHGAGLTVPMTDYGLVANILQVPARVSGQEGQVTAHAWVAGCTGTVSMNPPPAGYKAHWTLHDPSPSATSKPKAQSGGAPLTIKGLAHLAFTVSNERGVIAHAHAEICTALDAPSSAPALV